MNYPVMDTSLLFRSEHLFVSVLVTIDVDTERVDESMAFDFPNLGFDYDALEPAIDTRTMRLHHDKHHQAYVHNLNMAIAPYPALDDRTIEDLLMHLHDAPADIREAIRNNGGGHFNHSLFWKTIGPPTGAKPLGAFADAIKSAFGTCEILQEKITEAALKVFGSGWVFLAIDPDTEKLEIMSLPNQDVVMLHGKLPLLACDVWEHSYYLKYENRRPEYLKAFWDVVQWDAVSSRYESALQEFLVAAT